MSAPKPGVSITPVQTGAAPAPGLPPGVFMQHKCLVAPGFWYHDHVLFDPDPPLVYAHLVSMARRLVRAWDPYMFDVDAALFQGLQPGVRLEILTEKGFDPRRATMASQIADFAVNLRATVPAGSALIACHNPHNGIANPFHDRYLFIDDDVYMVGASLAYHHRVPRGSGAPRISSHSVLQVSDQIARDLLLDRFRFFWSHSATVLIP